MRAGFVAILLLLVTFFAPGMLRAQDSDSEALPRVGILIPNIGFEPVVDGFREEMAARGYVEDETIMYLYYGPSGDALADHAQALAEAEVDVILTAATSATRAALSATDNIPVVFASITDPLGEGFVRSLAAPGGNATGTTNGFASLPRLEYFLLLVPNVERLLIVYDENDSASVASADEILPALGVLGVEPVMLHVPLEQSEAALGALPDTIDAIFLTAGTAQAAITRRWAQVAFARRIPLTASRGAGDGVLLSYSDDLFSTGRVTADFVEAILNGADPATMPVVRSDFILSINAATAAELRIAIGFGSR